jgi:hypothetical protein
MGEAGGTAGAEAGGWADWEGAMGVKVSVSAMGMMVSVGWARLAVVPGGDLRLPGLAGEAGGLAVARGAGGGVGGVGGGGGGGAVEGEAVGAVGGRDSMGDAEFSRGVLLGLLSVRSVLLVEH